MTLAKYLLLLEFLDILAWEAIIMQYEYKDNLENMIKMTHSLKKIAYKKHEMSNETDPFRKG